MKKTLNKICSLMAIALLSAYCAPIEHDTETLESILKGRQTLTQSTSYYLGRTATDADAYSLRLMSEGIRVDYTISGNVIVDNTYSGSGYIISIDSLFAGPSDALAFPVGTFDIKESISRIYVVVLHGGSSASAAEKIQVVEGTVTVAQSGDKYTVAIDATNINGSELEVSYTGSIEVAPATIYANEPLAVSTQNFEIEEIAFESNNVDVDRDSQVDLSLSTLTLTGAKTRIVIDEIVGLPYMIGAEPKRPEAGTYNLTEWTYEDSSFTPGEIYNGQLTGSYAWLLSNPETPSFSEMWYFTEAQMVVSETNGVYSIQITATSANGSTITATYVDGE